MKFSSTATSSLFAKHVLKYLVSLNLLSLQEICLGIMGNLVCHESLVAAISLKKGLIATVVEQLFLDDVKCLSETFRLGIFGIKFFFCRTQSYYLEPIFYLFIYQPFDKLFIILALQDISSREI